MKKRRAEPAVWIHTQRNSSAEAAAHSAALRKTVMPMALMMMMMPAHDTSCVLPLVQHAVELTNHRRVVGGALVHDIHRLRIHDGPVSRRRLEGRHSCTARRRGAAAIATRRGGAGRQAEDRKCRESLSRTGRPVISLRSLLPASRRRPFKFPVPPLGRRHDDGWWLNRRILCDRRVEIRFGRPLAMEAGWKRTAVARLDLLPPETRRAARRRIVAALVIRNCKRNRAFDQEFALTRTRQPPVPIDDRAVDDHAIDEDRDAGLARDHDDRPGLRARRGCQHGSADGSEKKVTSAHSR